MHFGPVKFQEDEHAKTPGSDIIEHEERQIHVHFMINNLFITKLALSKYTPACKCHKLLRVNF